MLIVPTTFKSVSIRSFLKMNLHNDCHAVLSRPINVSTLIKIVIVISRFLERSQTQSRGNQLIHRRLSKIDRQRVRSLEFQNTQGKCYSISMFMSTLLLTHFPLPSLTSSHRST